MKNKIKSPLLVPVLFLLSLIVNPSFANKEMPNPIYVKSSERWGVYYAKCVPEEPYGAKGKTYIYEVTKGKDKLIHTFDWYSPEVYLLDDSRQYVVMLGVPPRQPKVAKDHLAIAFYKDGKLLKSYSTFDLAGSEEAWARISHYPAFVQIKGFRNIVGREGSEYTFDVETIHAQMLSFHVNSGEILTKEDETSKR